LIQKVQRVCLTCRQVFSIYPSEIKRNRGKYCSRRCRTLRVPKICLVCGKEFLVELSNHKRKYCSRKCQNQAATTKVKLVCPTCNNEFEACNSEVKKRGRKYCSRKCSVIASKGRIPWWSVGKPSWNKGKPHLSGTSHPLFEKGHTEKSKKKMSDSHMGKIPWNKGTKGAQVAWNKGIAYLQITGDKHPNWNGGSSFFPYCNKFNDNLKVRIRERDNHTCQLCGAKENGRKLDVHHVHYDKENCEPDLVCLCMRCNLKVNNNRDYYEGFFIELLKSRGLIC